MKKLIVHCLLCCFSSALLSQVKTIQERLGYAKDAKLVIIHADDLGVSHSENSASIEAMESGSVSSASIMVPCPWFPEIAAYSRTHPDSDLGLHLTLTSEWKFYKWGPVSSKDKVPGLVNADGYFYSTVDSVYASAPVSEVKEEIRNQVLKAREAGMDPTHLDAHMGTALYNADYFRVYLETGREFGIPVFIPRDLETYLKLKFDTLLTAQDVLVDNVFSATPDDFKSGFGEFYSNGIRNLKPGLTYLIIHVARDNEEMQAITVDHPDWGAAWRQQDFDFFTSPECAEILKDNNIHVITWREIRDKITRTK